MKSHGTAVLEVCDPVFSPFNMALCLGHAVRGHVGFTLEMPQDCNMPSSRAAGATVHFLYGNCRS